MHVLIYIHRQPRNRGPAKTSSTQNWKSAHVFESPVIAVNRLSSHIITAGDWRPNSRATLTLMPSVLWQFSHLFNVWTAIETNKKKKKKSQVESSECSQFNKNREWPIQQQMLWQFSRLPLRCPKNNTQIFVYYC